MMTISNARFSSFWCRNNFSLTEYSENLFHQKTSDIFRHSWVVTRNKHCFRCFRCFLCGHIRQWCTRSKLRDHVVFGVVISTIWDHKSQNFVSNRRTNILTNIFLNWLTYPSQILNDNQKSPPSDFREPSFICKFSANRSMIIARICSLDAMLGNFQLPSSYLSKQNFWERILRNFINVFNYPNKALWDKHVKTFGCIWNSDYIDSRKASTKQSRGYQMCEGWVWSSKSSLLWQDFRELTSLLVMISQLGRLWWSVNSNMLNNLMIPFNRLMLCRSSPALPYELETHKKSPLRLKSDRSL